MIRRAFLPLLLALLLVFAQQLALLHPYAHVAGWQSSAAGENQSLPHDKVCEKCVSLAHVFGALTTTPLTLNIAPQAAHFLLAATFSVVFAVFPAYHSRAPPNLA